MKRRSDPDSGVPGGGRGRRDRVDPTGVYPVSAGIPEGKHLEIRTPAAWGQGDRGATGYYDSGESELSIPPQTAPAAANEAQREPPPSAARLADETRAAQQISGHLSTLGIEIDADADIITLRTLAEAVERFENAVRGRGGNLMVDEAPRDSRGQPDDRDFALPRPRADESIPAYLERLAAATRRVLGQ
jgi:hypothetical protein